MASEEGLDAHVKTGGEFANKDREKIGIGWDEVQEAPEDRHSRAGGIMSPKVSLMLEKPDFRFNSIQ